MIPFLDLKRLNEPYFLDFEAITRAFLTSGRYMMAEKLETFEKEFANFCQTKHCLGVGNGLDALEIIWQSYGFPQGSEVIVPANTFIASILSILNAGLIPVFAEPNLNSYLIDYQEIESKITPKTVAILVVHLYGKCVSIEPIKSIATQYDLKIVEDAAQAHGATDALGNVAGSLGDAAAFSFYPTKNLGALADGGAITTNDDVLAERIKKIRNYGSAIKYKNEIIGRNSRLDELQAAFLSHKLQFLAQNNARRRAIAARYLSEIKSENIILPPADTYEKDTWHLFVVRHADRANLMAKLSKKGIGTMIHYPIPPHRQVALAAFSDLQLPITEKIHREVLSLPLNTYMTEAEVDEVVKAVNDC